MSLPMRATGLRWLWWPRVRARWRFNTTTLRAGSLWWSSGGPLATSGHPPRATVPRNGGHQPKDWQAIFFITVGNHELFLDFGDCVSEVVRSFWLGAWYSRTGRRLVACYVLLVSFSSSPSLVWSVPPLLRVPALVIFFSSD